MYILFILFFASFFSIIFMVGRKLRLIQNSGGVNIEVLSFQISYGKNIKTAVIQNLKKYGHIALVGTLRMYVRSKNFLKNKYEEMTKRRESNSISMGEVKINKFLKMVSEYKHKIREITHKIHEEENNL